MRPFRRSETPTVMSGEPHLWRVNGDVSNLYQPSPRSRPTSWSVSAILCKDMSARGPPLASQRRHTVKNQEDATKKDQRASIAKEPGASHGERKTPPLISERWCHSFASDGGLCHYPALSRFHEAGDISGCIVGCTQRSLPHLLPIVQRIWNALIKLSRLIARRT